MKRILRTAVRPSSILPALTGSVCRRVAAVVFLAVVVLDAAVTVPMYLQERDAFVRERSAEALSLLAAAVDPTRYPSIEALTQKGESLVRGTKIAGGVVISGAGEERAVFGTPPGLTWAQARLDGETVRFSASTGDFDIFISPEETKLPYGLILRLDVAEDWSALTRHLTHWALLSLVVALIVSGVTVLIVANQVVRPLATIRGAVDATLNGPEEAGGIRTGVSRTDEIGALARAVDQLLFLTSATFTDELAAALAIIERAPHGILTFSEQGHLMSANAAALSLFGEKSFEGLLARPPDSLFRFDDETVSGARLAARGKVLGPGEILNKDGDYPCLIAGDTARRADGSVLRRFLIFVDMRHLVEQVRSEVHRRETAEREVKRLSGELRLLRRMFDACLVLSDLDGTGEARSNAVTVIPEGLIEAWRSRLAAADEFVPAHVEVGDLPPVLGEPAELRRLFDTALEIVRSRSHVNTPRLEVAGNIGSDGLATFTVREVDESGADVAASMDRDVALLLGALGVLCRRQGGAPSSAGGDGANGVSFRLKVDRASINLADPASAESEAA